MKTAMDPLILTRLSRRLSILFLILFVFSTTVHGQELWDKSLEELVNIKVVSATRMEATALHLPSVVTVLSEEELSRWGAENLADGLRMAAGMQIRKSPADFPQYSASVRGNSADFLNIRTLFMIDGVPVRNPNAGFDPGWIPLSIVKQVEIVKGPASNLYGANAFGGVVNVITKDGENMNDEGKWGADASLDYHTQRDVVKNSYVGGASGHLCLGKSEDALDSFISAQVSDVNNRDGTFPGHQYQDVFGKLRYRLSDNVEILSSTLLSYDRNQVALTNTDAPIQNDFIHAALSANVRVDEQSNLSLTGHFSQFNHYLNYTDSLDKYDNQGRVSGLSSQYTTRWDQNHSLVIGAEFAEEKGSLETMENDYTTFPPTLKKAGWSPKIQNTYGVYSQYQYTGWDQYLPMFGIRYDTNSTYGSAVSPRVALSYLASDNTTFYSSIGSGFRAPVFNETEIQGFGKLGNPNLKPEYTVTYEVGAKSVYLTTQNAISVFKEDISRKISLEPVPSTNLSTYANDGSASITGIEIDGAYKPASNFRIFYNTTLLRTDTGSHQQMDRVAEQKFVLGSNWTLKSWTLDLAAVHESEMFFYNSNASIPSDSQGRVFLPSITTVNLQVKKQLSMKTFGTVYINNLTDQTYKEIFSPFIVQDGLYLPGRSFGFKLNSQFE
jgi:outer membrane receptor for ferrienterochelin and colicins